MDGYNFELEELIKSIDILNLSPESYEQGNIGNGTDYSGYSHEDLERLGFREPQIEEIEIGIQQKLPVWHYAKDGYNWKQMREIRLGLLENLDTKAYNNTLFEWEQMREIRLGLLDSLDVSTYASLVFSARDMTLARKELLSEEYKKRPSGYAKEIFDKDSGVGIRISDDCMEAYMTVPADTKRTMAELERLLNGGNITYGISKSRLEKLAKGEYAGKEVLVAKGTPATKGKDGWYEYFFNPLLPDDPQEQEDGSVDYTQVMTAEKREKGDILARYYPAEKGSSGSTVTGIKIKGIHGKERPAFRGQGIARDVEKNIYTATASGYVVLDEDEGTLNVWNVLVVNGDINRYNGNITYDGIIHIKGSVSDMAKIEATGNVIVDGYVEAAYIKAGENIILKSGMNGCGKGVLEAGGKVGGSFFEGAVIYARGNVEGSYFLNCSVLTDKSVIAKGTKSRIIGGSIKAGYSVEACSLMEAGKAATVIDVGNPAWIARRLKEVEERLEKAEHELFQLNEGKAKLDSMFGENAETENALYHKIGIAVGMKEEETQKLRQEKDYCLQMSKRAQKAYIRVYGKVQAGVTITVCGKSRRINKDLNGKVIFRKERA